MQDNSRFVLVPANMVSIIWIFEDSIKFHLSSDNNKTTKTKEESQAQFKVFFNNSKTYFLLLSLSLFAFSNQCHTFNFALYAQSVHFCLWPVFGELSNSSTPFKLFLQHKSVSVFSKDYIILLHAFSSFRFVFVCWSFVFTCIHNQYLACDGSFLFTPFIFNT